MPKATATGAYNADEPGYFDDNEPEPATEPIETSEETTDTKEDDSTSEPSTEAQETSKGTSEPSGDTKPPVTLPASVLTAEPVANPGRITFPKLD